MFSLLSFIKWDSVESVQKWSGAFDYSGALDFVVAGLALISVAGWFNGKRKKSVELATAVLALVAGACWVFDTKLDHRLSDLQQIDSNKQTVALSNALTSAQAASNGSTAAKLAAQDLHKEPIFSVSAYGVIFIRPLKSSNDFEKVPQPAFSDLDDIRKRLIGPKSDPQRSDLDHLALLKLGSFSELQKNGLHWGVCFLESDRISRTPIDGGGTRIDIYFKHMGMDVADPSHAFFTYEWWNNVVTSLLRGWTPWN